MKKTSGALITSVLALTLCFVMLLGTTWAWFTDEVTSAGNIIQAGTLKIDLIHVKQDGTEVSLKETPLHKVFDYALWEPGYTQYESLKITNMDSTLALKFRLNAVVTANAVLGDNGENLADVIDVYVANGVVAKPANFAALTADSAWRKAGTLTELMQDPDGVAYGVIVPNDAFMANLTAEEQAFAKVEEVAMTLALHMREEAGNEYQGLSVGDISLNLFATQYTYENDSFDHKYDKDALYAINEVVSTADVEAIVSGDDDPYFDNPGYSYTLFKDTQFNGDASVVINNNREVIIDNCVVDLDGNFVVLDEYNPLVLINNTDFVLDDGEYIVDASQHNGPVYQIMLNNVTINGKLITTNAEAAPYMNNVGWYGVSNLD